MKLLLVAEAYAPRFGGGVRYEVDIVEHFRKLGHEVDVVTVGPNLRFDYRQEVGGRVYNLAKHFEFSSARLSANMLPFLSKRIRQYDLVHFNAPNPQGEFSYWVMRHIGRKASHAVCSFHGEVVSQKSFSGVYNSRLLPSHLRACHRVIASSPNIVNSTSILANLSNIAVIPYGVDTDKFRLCSDWTAEVPNRPLRFLFVGRLVRYKGLFMLIEAFNYVGGTLDIIGEGPLRLSLEKIVQEHGLADRVFFRGAVSDAELIRHYQDADVFVLPSIDRGESFGYVLAEALACGACVISTELGTGTSYVNLNGETGLVVPPNDVNALANAMNLLCQDRILLTRYRAHARQRALNLFSRGRMLQQTIEMYQELGLNL